MRELRTQRFLTIDVALLREHRNDRHEHTQKTVLEDTDPDNLSRKTAVSLLQQAVILPLPGQPQNRTLSYIEPGQTAARCPPDSMLPAAAFL